MPEVEIVQMKYVENGLQSVLNSNWEYRPKLYKRLRTFKWIDPIHETVRTEPVVFDSDIEILHMPESGTSIFLLLRTRPTDGSPRSYIPCMLRNF